MSVKGTCNLINNSMAERMFYFCSLCDPSSVGAEAWCSDCVDFLCSECCKHHSKSKASKHHSLLAINEYECLPQFVRDLTIVCEHHGEENDLFCVAHNCPCCVKCIKTTHKSCRNFSSLKDLLPEAKTSQSMSDLETSIKDMTVYFENLTTELSVHKEHLNKRENEIKIEVSEMRKSLNKYLDKLEENLLSEVIGEFENINCKGEKLMSVITDLSGKVKKISKDFGLVQTYASNKQSLFSTAPLQTMVSDIEIQIKSLQTGKPCKCHKTFLKLENLTQVITDHEKMGRVDTSNEQCATVFRREKEKQAQILGAVQTIKSSNLDLQLTRAVSLELVEYKTIQAKIYGCLILSNGSIITSEYHPEDFVDRVRLHDKDFRYISTVKAGGNHSLFNLLKLTIDTEELFAVLADKNLICFNTNGNIHYHTFQLVDMCYAATFFENNIFCCTRSGLYLHNVKLRLSKLLLNIKFNKFAYITYHDNKLYFTRGDKNDGVSCCSDEGEILWTFKDPSILQRPRGIVADKNGNILVAGNTSNNIVVIGSNGNYCRELIQVTNPRALGYNEQENELVVCTESSSAYIVKIMGQ